MSVQIALLAPATRVASRKLGPTAGSALASSPSCRLAQAWATSRLARTCGRWETHRHQAVVGLRVDRGRARAEASQQRVQALVEDAGGALRRRRQVPGGAVEQVLAGVLDAGRLGARQRVAADEALVGARRRRASRLVEPTSVTTQSRAGRFQRLRARSRASAPTGAATNTTSRAGDRRRDVSRRRCRSRPARSARRANAGVGVVAADLAPRRAPRAARPIEPPIRPTPRTATLKRVPGRQRRAERLARQRRGALDGLRRTRRRRPPAAPAARRRSPRRGSGAPRR